MVEGYHPFPDHPGAEMCIAINEAKSVDDAIFNAMRRCTGFSVWLEVSSPGRAFGHFFTRVSESRQWEDGYCAGKGFTRRITAYDCPHIPVSEIEEAKGELPDWLFNSIYLALFSSVDEQVIIMPEVLAKIIQDQKKSPPKHVSFGTLSAGVDFAAGGA